MVHVYARIQLCDSGPAGIGPTSQVSTAWLVAWLEWPPEYMTETLAIATLESQGWLMHFGFCEDSHSPSSCALTLKDVLVAIEFIPSLDRLVDWDSMIWSVFWPCCEGPSRYATNDAQLHCRVRMHYGHPDVFDRIFHLSRGGISKASRVINLSEDIFAGLQPQLHLLSHSYNAQEFLPISHNLWMLKSFVLDCLQDLTLLFGRAMSLIMNIFRWV